MVVLVCLSFGISTGRACGTVEAWRLEESVNGLCPVECDNFVVGPRTLAGLIVAQDGTRTAIDTVWGLELVRTSDILLVYPSQPRTGVVMYPENAIELNAVVAPPPN
jgi:hypothetical protein